MADRFRSRQVHADDDKSDDYQFEEGRRFATITNERGDSDWATDNEYTDYLLRSPQGRYPTLYIQGVTGLKLVCLSLVPISPLPGIGVELLEARLFRGFRDKRGCLPYLL